MLIPGLRIDQESAVPVYRQIADGVRQGALDGRLEAGHRLPPTRDLARQLGVNRQTVVAAYEHLAAEGWVHSRTGKGTFVARPPEVDGGSERTALSPEAPADWLTSFSHEVEAPAIRGLLSVYQAVTAQGRISFAGSYPASELMPVEAFSRAMAAALSDSGAQALAYGATAGHPPLREFLASGMRARGSQVDADNILITNGAQQGIELVFHTFLDRGDAVIIEEPTYTGALSVLGSMGARVVAVPVDEHGARPDLLAIAMERHRPRLIYLQPTFHNPTTTVMNEARRREILSLAQRNRCVVVEDDWAGDLRLEGQDLPTLHALDGGRQVIYLSTFSKKLMPGLRVGWVAAPPPVMERLLALKQIRDCGTSPLLQIALHAFLREGGLEAHLQNIRPAYRERRDIMRAALERHFPQEVEWTRPQGGLFFWVRLPRDYEGQDLFLAAQHKGVLYNRGEHFHSHANGRHAMRMTFSAASPSAIEEGVAILGSLIRERWPDGSRSSKTVEAMPIL